MMSAHRAGWIVLLLAPAPSGAGQEARPGACFRVETGDVVEVPGVSRIDVKGATGDLLASDEETITVVLPGSAQGAPRELTLPRPRTALVGTLVRDEGKSLTLAVTGRRQSVTVPRDAILRLAVVRCGTAAREAARQSLGPRLSLGAAFGGFSGGPADALERAMGAAGLGEDAPGGCLGWPLPICVGPTAYPYSTEGWFAGLLQASYRVRPRVQVRLLRSSGTLGSTMGHREPLTTLSLDTSVTAVAALASYRVTEAFWLGAGPSLTSVTVSSDLGPEYISRYRKLGLTLEASLAYPPRTRLFLELAARHHHVRPVALDPIPVQDLAERERTTTLPATRLPPSHTTFSLGFGLRL